MEKECIKQHLFHPTMPHQRHSATFGYLAISGNKKKRLPVAAFISTHNGVKILLTYFSFSTKAYPREKPHALLR